MNLKPHCLALALACAGLAGPLPALAATPAAAQSAPVTVLASLPVTHALAERLLRDTEVKLQRVAPANLPASRQASFFAGRGAGGLAKAAGQADAVIDLRSIWSDDPLYPLARRSNIRIVEIDAARPVDGALPGIALRPGSDLHAYPWLNPTNLGRMADVLASDLERLAPGAAATIQANLATLKKQLLEATASNETRLAKADNLSVISLSERPGYLLAGLNLDPLDVEIQADDGWTETNIQAFAEELKSEDIALVLHHRQPPKPLADAIAASGARLVVVDTEAADPVAGLESDMKAIVEGLLAGKG
ncbi:TPA: metal ABC transporter substrate-binding protein [Pseudomonas aeruginosa]|nr:metal ABC transporter substrate-binding protein [Pseudomonas aeruginosa]